MASDEDTDQPKARKPLTIHLPPGLPEPSPRGWRILLEILVELSTERGFQFEKDRKPAPDVLGGGTGAE